MTIEALTNLSIIFIVNCYFLLTLECIVDKRVTRRVSIQTMQVIGIYDFTRYFLALILSSLTGHVYCFTMKLTLVHHI